MRFEIDVPDEDAKYYLGYLLGSCAHLSKRNFVCERELQVSKQKGTNLEGRSDLVLKGLVEMVEQLPFDSDECKNSSLHEYMRADLQKCIKILEGKVV